MRCLSFLLPLLLFAAACSSEATETSDAGPDTTKLFVDVTGPYLPTETLLDLNMDARPADFDGDGDLDLLIASEFRQNILLLNDGTGRFTDVSARLPALDRDSEDVGIADFDDDGDLDAIVVAEDDQINELYLNNGDGTFVDGSDRIPVTGTSNAVLVADLDGNGTPDILIGNNGQNVALLNDGAAQFTDATARLLPRRDDVTQDLELADLDGDGDLDLIVGNEGANRILLNDGTGRFADAPADALPLREAPEETREADAGDVDGDGDLDLFFANVALFVDGADPQNRLLLNDGTGRFTDVTAEALPADADQTFDGDFIDLDGDGDLDLATANLGDLQGRRAETPYRAYLNDGTGRFTDETARVFPASLVGNGLDLEAADFNGDGLLDLYLVSRGGTDRLALGRRD